MEYILDKNRLLDTLGEWNRFLKRKVINQPNPLKRLFLRQNMKSLQITLQLQYQREPEIIALNVGTK